MKPKGYKTTEKDFQFFTEECEYWIKRLGLIGWRINIVHENHKGRIGPAAWAQTGFDPSLADIGLPKDHICKQTPRDISNSAFHEVCHVLLRPIEWSTCFYVKDGLNMQRIWADRGSDTEHEIHRVIHTLANLLWEPYWVEREKELKGVKRGQTSRKSSHR